MKLYSKVWFIKKNKLKIVYKIISVQKQSSRGVLQGRYFRNMKQIPQETKNAEAQSQQSHFATLLKSDPHTDTHRKTHSTSAEHPPRGEYLWGSASACQEKFKRLKL